MSRIEQALLRTLDRDDTDSFVAKREPRPSRPDPRLRLVSTGHAREAARPALSGVEGPAAENPYVRRSIGPAPKPRLHAPDVEFQKTPVAEPNVDRVLEQASALARIPALAAVVSGFSRARTVVTPAPVAQAFMAPTPIAPAVVVAAPPVVDARVGAPAPVTEQGFVWVPVQSYTQAGGAVLASPVAAEQFRKLAGQVIRAQETHGVKVVTITSALQGEGKSFTSSSLALTLANSYKRDVLLVDADMRLPSLQTLFQLPAGWGLSELLDQARTDQISPYQVSPMLGVLTAGRPNRDPVGALTSSRMREFIEAASAKYDFVIIDTPPVAVLPDANLLGSMVDAVLLVIATGETQYEFVSRAVEAIKKERILGVVMNRAEHGPALKAYEYSKY